MVLGFDSEVEEDEQNQKYDVIKPIKDGETAVEWAAHVARSQPLAHFRLSLPEFLCERQWRRARCRFGYGFANWDGSCDSWRILTSVAQLPSRRRGC